MKKLDKNKAIAEKIKKHNSKRMTPAEAIVNLNDGERFNKRYEEAIKTVLCKLQNKLTMPDSLERKEDKEKVIKYITDELVKIDSWETDGLPKRHFNENFGKSSLNNIIILEYRKKGLNYAFDEIFYFTSNGGYYTINLSTGSIGKDELIRKAEKDDKLKSVFSFINGDISLKQVNKHWQFIHEDNSDEYVFIDCQYQKDMAKNYIRQCKNVLKNNGKDYHLAFEVCSKELLKKEINGFGRFLGGRYRNNVKNLFDPNKDINNRIFAIKLCFVLGLNFEEANIFLNRACGVRAINNRRNLFDNIFEYCLTHKEPYSTFETLLNAYESSNYTVNKSKHKYSPGASGITTIMLGQQASLFFSSLSKKPKDFLDKYLLKNRQKFIDNSHKIIRIYDELRAQTSVNYMIGVLEKFNTGGMHESNKSDTASDIYEINKIFDALSSDGFISSLDNFINIGGEEFPEYIQLRDNASELKEKLNKYFSQDYFKPIHHTNKTEARNAERNNKFYSKEQYIKERVSNREIALYNEYNLRKSKELDDVRKTVCKLVENLKKIEIYSELKFERIILGVQSLEKLRLFFREKPGESKKASEEFLGSIKKLIEVLDSKELGILEKSETYVKTKSEQIFSSLKNELGQQRSLYIKEMLGLTRDIGHLVSTDRIVAHVVPIEYTKRTKENNYKASPKLNISKSSLYDNTFKNLPKEEYLNEFENGKLSTFSESIRKTIILMFFFGYIINWRIEDTNKNFDDFYNHLYNLLDSCNLSPMDDKWDRFDWLILKTVQLYNDAKTEDDYKNASIFIYKVIKLSISDSGKDLINTVTDDADQYLINSDKKLILLSSEDEQEKILIIYSNDTCLNKENLDFEYVKDYRNLKSNEIAIWRIENKTLIQLFEKLKSENNNFNVQDMLWHIGKLCQKNYCERIELSREEQGGNGNIIYRYKTRFDKILIDAIKNDDFLIFPDKYANTIEDKYEYFIDCFEFFEELITRETMLKIVEYCT